ncbi:MAG: GTPase Era [Verrucomicrobia bacterium]|nr:GTPase Era [Verrucomicrobiota bacterium]
MDNNTEETFTKKAGMIAVVGAANAGKSSLINRMMDEKISIVSPVAQTTRNLVRAIHTEERGQVVFLDTPGVHRGKKALNKQMNKVARGATEGTDAVMLVIDRASAPALEVDGWMRKLRQPEIPPVLIVLNKCDCHDNHEKEIRDLFATIAAELPEGPEPEWHVTSAETGAGVDELLSRLFAHSPVGPALFPEDIVSDFPRKLAIGDVIREKYFMRLHQELPHSLAVWVEHLQETPGEWKIEAHVYVLQNSQKGMVIGNKGRLMKEVRGEAASEIAEIYGVRVKLTLVIKVLKDWDKNFWILRKLGYA